MIVFIGFAGMMSYMVYRCTQTPVDLVAKEYYRDELAYQDIIDGTKKANALSARISVTQDSGRITIQFPPEMQHRSIKGNILFYCTADAKKDRTMELRLDEAGKQQLDARTFFPGNYVVKIKWESSRDHYYTEQPFIIL